MKTDNYKSIQEQMKFDKQVPREAREFITQQLKEYEQTTKMNKEERHQLHEWILSIVLRKFIFKLNRHGYHTPVRPGSVKSAVHEACS